MNEEDIRNDLLQEIVCNSSNVFTFIKKPKMKIAFVFMPMLA